MDFNRLISLSNKLRNRYKTVSNVTDVYNNLLDNKFIKDSVEPFDIIKLSFYIITLNKGLSPNQSKLLIDNLFSFSTINIGDADPVVECSNCEGMGAIKCDNCYDEGEIECSDCEGSGEDEHGETCDYCDGDGYVTCNHCDGDGEEICDECEGSGDKIMDNFNEVETYDFVSINPEFRNLISSLELPYKISEDTQSLFIENPYTITLSLVSDNIDDYYDDFENGDVVISNFDEQPFFKYNSSVYKSRIIRF